nr:MAG TPA: hypothetical protein [Caudoviricetes sp.]
MSGATNNPYKRKAPDKTLSVEGVAADAKAVGDALGKKSNKLALKSASYSGRTDQYSQISTRAPDDAIAILAIVSSETMFIPMSLSLAYATFRCMTGLSSLQIKFAPNTNVSGTMWYLAYAN